jgi:hypothetical protein
MGFNHKDRNGGSVFYACFPPVTSSNPRSRRELQRRKAKLLQRRKMHNLTRFLRDSNTAERSANKPNMILKNTNANTKHNAKNTKQNTKHTAGSAASLRHLPEDSFPYWDDSQQGYVFESGYVYKDHEVQSAIASGPGGFDPMSLPQDFQDYIMNFAPQSLQDMGSSALMTMEFMFEDGNFGFKYNNVFTEVTFPEEEEGSSSTLTCPAQDAFCDGGGDCGGPLCQCSEAVNLCDSRVLKLMNIHQGLHIMNMLSELR